MMTNPTGRITQGQFSFLPHLTDAEIERVVASCRSFFGDTRSRAGARR